MPSLNSFKFAFNPHFKTRIWIGEQALLKGLLTAGGGGDSAVAAISSYEKSCLGALEANSSFQSFNAETGALSIFASYSNDLSRNLPSIRVDKITKIAKDKSSDLKHSDLQITLVVSSKQDAYLAALAVCRNWPIYNRKTASDVVHFNVTCDFVGGVAVDISAAELDVFQSMADSIRNTQRLMDHPCDTMNTSAMVKEAQQVVASLNNPAVSIKIIQGKELDQQGFGGIYGVGKGAATPPALVILSYHPKDAKKTLAMVGKGIVYDTGGLSIKATAGMCEMKFDKGGACAILNAFQVIVKSQSPHNIHALLCCAENAVGPESFRNDDILTLYSGKTVEINNTDAEGRLVLGDGVAYASKHLNPDILVDMATLTGAQLITTGVKHAGLLTNSDGLEKTMLEAGKACGDLVFPMLYCPQLLKKEFNSEVADMKNSVKNRMNAQSSCAGHFVESHIHEEWKGEWAHVDIAGPSVADGRGTGFGVALLYELSKRL